MKPKWLSSLISKIKIGVLKHFREWRLERLLILGKYVHNIQFCWESLRALIELWHPQTHTFIFPSFEVTILLEEVEILLDIKSSSDGEIACPLGEFHVLNVL